MILDVLLIKRAEIMLASQLINTHYPSVALTDKVSFVLHLMEEYEVQHLPVVSEKKFAGLISKDDLLNTDENNLLESLGYQLIKGAVKAEDHFLNAAKLSSEFHLSLIPVTNEQNELTGIITAADLLFNLSKFVGGNEPGGIIVLEVERTNYSFGEINRLVETNDAHITQLNTETDTVAGRILITLKVNKIEVSDIVATFQRYDYSIRFYFGEEQYVNELKENYHHLIAYLNI
jgi:CBS domain-containing protein